MLAELRAAGLRFTADGGKLYVEPASSLTDAQRATIRAHKMALLRELAGEANEPQGGGGASLSVVQEGARRQVLAQLKANPSVQRAFVNRFEHGAMIVTLAVRGIGRVNLRSLPNASVRQASTTTPLCSRASRPRNAIARRDIPTRAYKDMTRKKQGYLKGQFEHRRTEADYMAVMLDAVTLEEWRSVVVATLAAAKAGDASARAWLAQYLVGKPTVSAPAPLTVVVQQLSGRDPLVDKLSQPHIDRAEYPFLHDDDGMKDRVRALVAGELRALEAQKSGRALTDGNSDETKTSNESRT